MRRAMLALCWAVLSFTSCQCDPQPCRGELCDGGASGGAGGGSTAGAMGGTSGGAAGASLGGSVGGSAGGTSGGAAGGSLGGSVGGSVGGTSGGAAGGLLGGSVGGSAGGAAGGSLGGSGGGGVGGSTGGVLGGAGGGFTGGGAGGGSSGGTAGGAPAVCPAVDAGPGLPGDTCLDAELVSFPFARSDSLTGYRPDYAFGVNCPPLGGADRVYAVDLPAGHRLQAALTLISGSSSLQLVAGTAQQCHNTSTRTCRGDRSHHNNTTATERVFVVVSAPQPSSTAAYALSLTGEAPGRGDVCALADDLVPGVPLPNIDFTGLADDYGPSEGCEAVPTGRKDIAYRITVPARRRLTLSATAVGAVVIRLVDAAAGCEPIRCLASAQAAGSVPSELHFNNVSGTPREVVAILDEVVTPSSFSLTATIDDGPPGDVCETAPIGDGGVITATASGAANDYFGRRESCPPATPLNGPELAFGYDVPAGQRLSLTGTPQGLSDLTVWLLRGVPNACHNDSRACIAGANESQNGIAEVVRWYNSASTEQRVLAVVESSTGTGSFTLTSGLDTPLLGDVVELSGPPITAPVSLGGLSTVGYANDYSDAATCGAPGADRVHHIIVPPGKVLTVTAFPSISYNTRLSLMAGPPELVGRPHRCLTSANNAGAGQADTVFWTNSSSLAQSVLLVVDSTASGGQGTYALTISWADVPGLPPIGDTVFRPEPLCPGTFPNQSTATFYGDYAPDLVSCPELLASQGTGGHDRVWAVRLGAGQSLVAFAPSTFTSGAALYLLEGPPELVGAVPRCLAGATAFAQGGAMTLHYRNSATITRHFFLVLDSSVADVAVDLTYLVFD